MKKDTYIFDMDGVLIDSEPQWQAVEQCVFAQVGVTLTDEMVKTTTGLRCADVVEHWYKRFGWQGKTPQQVQADIIAGMLDCFEHQPNFKEGAKALVEQLSQIKGSSIAICSGSAVVLIESVVRGLGLSEYIKLIHSTEQDTFGKPHPMPYLKCAKKLGKSPDQCIVFEDSSTGAISAKAAGMYTIVIPDGPYKEGQFDFADEVISSLSDFEADKYRP